MFRFRKSAGVLTAFVFILAILVVGCGTAQTQSSAGQNTGNNTNTSQSASDFYKGKNIHLIVPHGAGGGYDTYARMLQPYIEKNLGATLIVDNVTGAGGVVGRNQVWQAQPDGLTFGFTSGTAMVYSQLSGGVGVQYKVEQITWLPRLLGEPSVLVVPAKGKYQNIQQLLQAKGQVRFAVSGVGDDDFFAVGLEGKAFGLDILPVTGYNSTKEGSLAVVRGEVDLFQTSLSTMLPLIQSGDVKPILVISDKELPELPGVPTATSVVSGPNADLVKTAINLIGVSRVFFAPPNLPQDKAKVLEEAINKAAHDPELVKKATDSGRPIDYLSAADVKKLISESVVAADKITPALKEIVKKAE